MSNFNKFNSANSCEGFSLIEVMVALVLLLGGLVSVAYMQNFSLQFGQESYHRSQIVVSANELIDSMRAKQISSDDGDAEVLDYTNAILPADVAAGCNPALSTARNDIICYAQEVSQNLPYGTTQVAVNAGDNRFFDISVFWSDRGLSEQAAFSDASVAESSVNLNTKADCNGAVNRIWSDVLTWPFGNQPDNDLCMVAHSWSVQILNTTTL